MKNLSIIMISVLFITVLSCSKDKPHPTETFGDYTVITQYPHDTSFFTQGFEISGDTIIESTGKYNSSKVLKYDLVSGNKYSEKSLPHNIFGEGATVLGEKIYQLTWTSEICLVYDRNDLTLIDTLVYTGEGWGLTDNGTELIMSNGSDIISYRNPDDMSVIRSISVKDSSGYSINKLNELEYAEGWIYANIWGSDLIIAVDPDTGTVKKKYDMSGLLNYSESQTADVLNGIAWDGSNFFITGKYWPKIFEIELK